MTTGAIYDLVQPPKNAMRPAGEWNQAEIKVVAPKSAFASMGEEVTEMNLDEWPACGMRPDGSAHKLIPHERSSTPRLHRPAVSWQ